MTRIVTKANKQTLLPWGVEIELFNGRCVYISAKMVHTDANNVHIKVNDDNTISVPREGVRKILMMCSNGDNRS
jgi:hypothetical protein